MTPNPELVRAARGTLTQAQAGALVHVPRETWAQWESGRRNMHLAFFELFLLRTGLNTLKGK